MASPGGPGGGILIVEDEGRRAGSGAGATATNPDQP